MPNLARKGEHEAPSVVGVDEDRRTLYLIGTVDEGMARGALVGLDVLDRGRGPIRIVLSSGGGAVDDGFAICDAIRICRNKVVVDGFGAVQSMAVMILQAGAVRRLAPECRLLLHDGSAGIADASPRAMDAFVREVHHQHVRYCEILAERADRPVKEVLDLCHAESFMGAQRAVDLGLADGILTPGKMERRRKR